MHRSLEGGFSLIEMVIALTVLSVALTGSMMVMQRTLRASADPMLSHQAIVIAETYLEEILLQSYIDPDLDPATGAVCPAAEGGRALYDNICDYSGLSDSGAHDQNDTAITGLGDYTIDVTVDTTATLNTLSGSSKVLRVDVQVTHPAAVDITLSGYRTKG
ncbi:MAG: prepilin-type N-terminal cleavage/methylation domain-containing protein [bacterium]|nr:prepilin-type N-terminal cleavage/methylation domain-containing protein [bacterium]